MLAILARRPVGHRIWTFTWSQFLREFWKTTARFGITLVPYQIGPSACPPTEHETFGHSKQHSAEGGGNSRNPSSDTGRALVQPKPSTNTQSVCKGFFLEQKQYPLTRCSGGSWRWWPVVACFIADFSTGLERWDERPDVSSRKGVGSFFTTSMWHLVQGFEHNASPFCTTTGASSSVATGSNDCRIVKSRGIWSSLRPVCCGRLQSTAVWCICLRCPLCSYTNASSGLGPDERQVDPHHLLRLRRTCHSGRGHCTCSGRPHASVDRTRTLPIQPVKVVSTSLMTLACASFPVVRPVRTTQNFSSQVSALHPMCRGFGNSVILSS